MQPRISLVFRLPVELFPLRCTRRRRLAAAARAATMASTMRTRVRRRRVTSDTTTKNAAAPAVVPLMAGGHVDASATQLVLHTTFVD